MRSERGAVKQGLLAGVLVLLAGAMAVGALLARPRGEIKPKLNHTTVPLGGFVVNLDPADGFRYLKVTLALEVETPLAGEALKEAASEARYRWSDVVVRTLTGQRYSALHTPEGRERIGRELVRRLNEEGKDGRFHVKAVYFSEFVAQ
ncbi:MAG: flagellar basal body-associated FliL family protein [Armatimonadota bacterium]|nr:flagellar basal body-associated FliL family protein [Armatimonadota bacterium]MDR7439028.1 flagellar basal body-associated FliL family protein [Armatimonadota bacterium]MDR7563598.1 flagellar basal body-associated FliL family protein [Armatimonadota bacterium]MDR7566846.1 flagellar basal body-associated FliL family protein [Armatimonadota bacterium]MDR7601203.1 flagellar basal body-associated FliL family protein [Armatimonadota bacterium]